MSGEKKKNLTKHAHTHTHTAMQLDGENVMTVSLKVKCHENPLMAVMSRMLVCIQHARKMYNMQVCVAQHGWKTGGLQTGLFCRGECMKSCRKRIDYISI